MSAPAGVPVTVIGLGPMGQAMTLTLMAGGHPVTVWNRTPSRADAVVSAGARLAATPAEAIGAADLIVLSLTEYRAMYEIVGDATAALSGKVLINLSSDSPDESRRATAWAGEHGAVHLTGGVMNPAPMVGTEDAYVYYSGDRAVFDRVEPTLRLIGTRDMWAPTLDSRSSTTRLNSTSSSPPWRRCCTPSRWLARRA